MVFTINMTLLLVALVLFILAAAGMPSRINLGWAGLAVLTIAFMVK